jgi:hypothetical protein
MGTRPNQSQSSDDEHLAADVCGRLASVKLRTPATTLPPSWLEKLANAEAWTIAQGKVLASTFPAKMLETSANENSLIGEISEPTERIVNVNRLGVRSPSWMLIRRIFDDIARI